MITIFINIYVTQYITYRRIPNVSDFREYLNCYEFDVTLPGSGDILKIKPFTTGQLKKLLVYENDDDPLKIDIILDELINTSVTTKGFDLNLLTLQDRFFLLVELRKKSKGTKYQYKMICDKCKSQSLQNIDLSLLKMIPVPKDMSPVVKLDDNITITMKYITRGSQKEAYATIPQTMKGATKIAEMAMLSYASSIVSITTPKGESELGLIDRIYLINNMTQEMFDKVKKWILDSTYGVDFKYTAVCNNCPNTRTMEISLENFFF